MSNIDFEDFKVDICEISEIIPHPNADRLAIAKIKGWQCVIQKDSYKAGDVVIYVPVDSILPKDLEDKLFPPDSKIKLTKSRIRAIKIRQFISQGMLLNLSYLQNANKFKVGDNVAKELGITKFEPPTPKFSGGTQASPISLKNKNPHFKEYSKFPRIENYPDMFDPEEVIVATEKIHGSNFRAGWVPAVANTFWRKCLKIVGLLPKWQFVYGSHRVQISEKLLYKGFYDTNVYAEMVVKYDLKNKLNKGHVIYGEIYGTGIQKDYTYDCKDEHKLIVFDIQENGKYLSYGDFHEICKEVYNLPVVPFLWRGKFKDAPIDELKQGKSILDPKTLVREGCVIKPWLEGELLPRKGAKVINPEYLLKNNSDFH